MEKKRFIGFEMRKLSNLVQRKLNNVAAEMSVDDVTITHGWVIRFLVLNEGRDVFQKDFEQKFSIRRSTATNILKLMEKNELISRVPVPYDARLKKIILTDKARELYEKMEEQMLAIENVMLNGVTPEELETLYRVFDKMLENIVKDAKE